MPKSNFLLPAVFLLAALKVSGGVELSPIFGDNMVLQQRSEVPVWGRGDPGSTIKIWGSWSEKIWSAECDDAGNWRTNITTSSFGGPYSLEVWLEDTIRINNILLGEVWFASGQSNMEMALSRSKDAGNVIAAADHSSIRYYNVPRAIEQIQKGQQGKWEVCAPETAGEMSAIAYYFARELNERMNVPVGIVTAVWGGTPAEAWMSREALLSDTSFLPIFRRWEQWERNIIADSAAYSKTLSVWENDSLKGHLAPKPEPPQSIYMVSRPHRKPSVLYNGMVSSVMPFKIKGVIWFQGTSNKEWFYEYGKLFKTLILSWREEWDQGDFPFYYIQNAPYKYQYPIQAAGIREAQLQTLSVKNTGMVVTMDAGERDNLHPANKEEVGARLAWWALSRTYGRKGLEYSGPIYKRHRITRKGIMVYFKHCGKGLTTTGGELRNFAISGADAEFFPARTRLRNHSVYVWSPEVKDPKSVRYAFGNVFDANFINKEGLPASPFRTDSWELKIIREEEK